MKIKRATQDDVRHIAYLTNLAGEGLAAYMWGLSSPEGQDALLTGSEKASSPEGNFSFQNAWIVDYQGKVAGMLLAMPQPDPYPLPDFDELPPQVKPLIELESLAPGSFYINAIGVYATFQGKGLGTALMKKAEELARAKSCRTLSLIVASENRSAKALYHKLGYGEIDRRPVIPFPGIGHGGEWILMTKQLDV